MNDAERTLYETTFFGRGENSVSTAGLFDLAHDLHVAAQAVGRIASRRLPGTTDTQHANRQALLKLAQGLLTRERDTVLDKFHHQWKPGEELGDDRSTATTPNDEGRM
jgi:hypothetical protein